MPRFDFAGASNFTISGGEFNDVAGGVTHYHFNSGPEGVPTGALATLANANGTNLPQRGMERQAEHERINNSSSNAQIRSVPSSNMAGSPYPNPISRTTSSSQRPHSRTFTNHPVSATTSPSFTETSFASDVEFDASSAHSGRSTPLTDLEEYQRAGVASGSSTSQHSVDTLTPLSNSLGLRRFTPGTEFEPLPTVQQPSVPPRGQDDALNTIPENPAEFGLQAPRYSPSPVDAVMHPMGPPPPVSPRPLSHTSNRSQDNQHQMQREPRSPYGPPPPIPPRPGTLSPMSRDSAPLHSGGSPGCSDVPPLSHARMLSPPVTVTSPTQNFEDPSARFARLQAQRPSTKGYASGLSNPRPTGVTRIPPTNAYSSYPSPPSTFSANSPPEYSDAGTPPLPNEPLSPDTASRSPGIAGLTAPYSPSNSTSGWASDVRTRGLGNGSLGESRHCHPQYQPPSHYHNLQSLPTHPSHPNHPAQLQNTSNRYWASQQLPPHPFGSNPVPNSLPFVGFPALGAPVFGASAFDGPAFTGSVFGENGSRQGFNTGFTSYA